MKISVIVPFFNAEETIESCIESLEKQDFDGNQYEILMVDNASTDRSCELVKRHPRIRLFHESRPGAYAARNKGLAHAQGAIIAFTDGDCAVSRDWLLQISRALESGDSAIVLGRRLFGGKVSLGLRLFESYENEKIRYVIESGRSEYFFAFTNNMAVRRELFEKVGVFLTWRRAADTEFLHRCLAYDPALGVVYAQGMRATHLEIKNIGDWLKKLYTYGETNGRVVRELSHKNLLCLDRIRILGRAIKKSGWPGIRGIGIMVCGYLVYQAGAFKYFVKKSFEG